MGRGEWSGGGGERTGYGYSQGGEGTATAELMQGVDGGIGQNWTAVKRT